MKTNHWVMGTASLQLLCASFFILDFAFNLLGLRAIPLSWQWRELMEIMAAVGLVIGAMVAVWLIAQINAQRQRTESQLKLLGGAFYEMLDECFTQWQLTPAEREVALYLIKGYGTQEIAQARGKSDGTVKAQTNAIYRKAQVSSRHALLASLLDELLVQLPES